MPVLLVLVCVMIHIGSHPVFKFHWNIIQLMFGYWHRLTCALGLLWGGGESKCWAGVYQVTVGWSAHTVRWIEFDHCRRSASKMALPGLSTGHPGDEKGLVIWTLVIAWTTRPSVWLSWLMLASIMGCYKALAMLKCVNTAIKMWEGLIPHLDSAFVELCQRQNNFLCLNLWFSQ